MQVHQAKFIVQQLIVRPCRLPLQQLQDVGMVLRERAQSSSLRRGRSSARLLSVPLETRGTHHAQLCMGHADSLRWYLLACQSHVLGLHDGNTALPPRSQGNRRGFLPSHRSVPQHEKHVIGTPKSELLHGRMYVLKGAGRSALTLVFRG